MSSVQLVLLVRGSSRSTGAPPGAHPALARVCQSQAPQSVRGSPQGLRRPCERAGLAQVEVGSATTRGVFVADCSDCAVHCEFAYAGQISFLLKTSGQALMAHPARKTITTLVYPFLRLGDTRNRNAAEIHNRILTFTSIIFLPRLARQLHEHSPDAKASPLTRFCPRHRSNRHHPLAG